MYDVAEQGPGLIADVGVDAADMALREAHDDMAALIHSSAAGCRASFESLYRRSSGRLLGIILRINRDHGEAEEVLQETYIKVWHQSTRFDARKGRASHWLGSIARNGAIDSLKRRQARPRIAVNPGLADNNDDLHERLPSADVAPLDSLIARRQTAAVQRCLQALPCAQRETLSLAFYSGLSHAEIASRLGQPLGTVKSWLRRSLLGMRSALDAER